MESVQGTALPSLAPDALACSAFLLLLHDNLLPHAGSHRAPSWTSCLELHLRFHGSLAGRAQGDSRPGVNSMLHSTALSHPDCLRKRYLSAEYLPCLVLLLKPMPVMQRLPATAP